VLTSDPSTAFWPAIRGKLCIYARDSVEFQAEVASSLLLQAHRLFRLHCWKCAQTPAILFLPIDSRHMHAVLTTMNARRVCIIHACVLTVHASF
jgi:hypothetical protein